MLLAKSPGLRFGGSDGVRDTALLESAVAAPQASFGGQSPYIDLAEVAAAYLFYLCRNHAFIDGNKRAGFLVAVVFLESNGYRFYATEVDAALRTLGARLLDQPWLYGR